MPYPVCKYPDQDSFHQRKTWKKYQQEKGSKMLCQNRLFSQCQDSHSRLRRIQFSNLSFLHRWHHGLVAGTGGSATNRFDDQTFIGFLDENKVLV